MTSTHHPHIIIDQIEKERFTGSVELFYDHGKLTKLIRHETVNVGPLPLSATWPPRETRAAEQEKG